MPGFVILEHDHPTLHWDLMLDTGDLLRTWRLSEPPAVPANIPAESLSDHRRDYLTYEGPVSNNRGHVRRLISGEWTLLANTPQTIAIRLDSVGFNANVSISPPSGQGVASFRHFASD